MSRELPSLWTMVKHILFNIVFMDVYFFYCHWIFHTRSLYV